MPTETCILTTRDYTILKAMRERLTRDDLLASILKRKLDTAQVVFREDVPANVATIGSRVTFSVDRRDADTRVISHDHTISPVGMFLAISTARGLALVGLSEAQEFVLSNSDGVEERILLEKVQYQAEAAQREREALGNLSTPAPRVSSLRLIRGSPRLDDAAGDEFDDPGPSAA